MPGIHTITVRFRAKAQGQLTCRITPVPAEGSFLVSKPHFLPDILSGVLAGGYVSIPVLNQGIVSIQVSLSFSSKDSGSFTVDSSAFREREYTIEPGQILPVPIRLIATDKAKQDPKCTLAVRVSVKGSGLLKVQETRVNFEKRTKGSSFVFTFLDRDGSVQHAAAVHPRGGCDSHCPILLTQHGTGVPARNQADSYKMMDKKALTARVHTPNILIS